MKSRNCNWYEGSAFNLPSTDNALESVNGLIKSIFTLRDQLPVNEYLTNAFDMLRDWSKDRDGVKPFRETVHISDQAWEQAYQLLFMSDTSKITRFGSRYALYDIADEHLKSANFIHSKYSKLDVTFDELVALDKKFARVDLNRVDWPASRCYCESFLKHYFCHHVITVAANEKLVTIADKHKNVPIGQKPKRGRKKKAKSALVHQN